MGQGALILLLLFAIPGLGTGQSKLSISRSVEKSGERQYKIRVTVQKGGLKGYAKLEEMIPEGFVASKEKTKGANYIFQDGKAKFIWMEFPKSKEFHIVYKLIQKRSKAGEYTIDGRLSCVSSDGELLRVENSSSFEVKAPQKLASEESSGMDNGGDNGKATDNDSSKGHNGSSRQELAGHNENVGAGAKEGDETEPKESSGDAEDPSWKEKGPRGSGSDEDVHFSVQIGAFGEKKSDAYFKERYGLESSELHHYREGELHKYSTGRFGTYEQAKKEKKRLRKEGLKGAFVIGFKGEKAVSASELR